MEHNNSASADSSDTVFSNDRLLEMDKINDVPMKPNPTVAVLGTGDFGRALTKRLSLAGFDVVMGSRSPESKKKCSILRSFQIMSIENALNHSDVVLMAIPHEGYDDIVELCGKQLQNKIVIDVSNPTQASSDGTSHAEYLASLLPGARVVKGFNMVSAWTLENDIFGGSRQIFICGDDQEAKDQVMKMARTIQLEPFDKGSLKMASIIENKPLELFPSWRVALLMFGVLYLIIVLYFVLVRVIYKYPFTNFPLRSFSLINAFSVIGVLDMVYLPGVIAALLQLAYGTKYRRFPRWLDHWMKARKQLGLIALTLAAMHGCMSTLYWAPEYNSRLYQKSSITVGDVSWIEYKKMFAQGEAFLSLGVLGVTSLCILGVTSLPTVLNRMSWREWNFVQSGLGYFALLCALLHYTIFVYEGLPKWKVRYIFYPTVLVVIIGYITLLLRLVLLTPCLANKVKNIRAGWERKNTAVYVV